MSLDHRLKRLESHARALPTRELPSILEMGRTDMETMRLLLQCARWAEAHPGVDPRTVPECAEREGELDRRYARFLASRGYELADDVDHGEQG